MQVKPPLDFSPPIVTLSTMSRLDEAHKALILKHISLIDRLWTAPFGGKLRRNLLENMKSVDVRVRDIHRQMEVRVLRRVGK